MNYDLSKIETKEKMMPAFGIGLALAAIKPFVEGLYGAGKEVLVLKQAIACLSESDFRSAAATEPAGLV